MEIMKKLLIQQAEEQCRQHDVELEYLTISGSHAFGTNTPESDIDVRGVFMPSAKQMLGISHIEQIKYGDDCVLHSFSKFMKLVADGNPSIMDWLFCPKDCVLYFHYDFRVDILSRCGVFLTKRMQARLGGYAHSHLMKMTHAGREMGAKRKAAIEKYGYSTKNAMHLIRLLRMGVELFRDGLYQVRRPDAEELLEIKAGKWGLKQVQAEARRLRWLLDEYALTSELPAKLDVDWLDQHMTNHVLEVWEFGQVERRKYHGKSSCVQVQEALS